MFLFVIQRFFKILGMLSNAKISHDFPRSWFLTRAQGACHELSHTVVLPNYAEGCSWNEGLKMLQELFYPTP